MNIETFLQTLQNHGCKPTRSGQGWAACCPAHPDRNPSLSVGLGDGGRILVCCHAGCPTEAVVEALGLKLADLFPADGQGPTRPIDNGMTLAEETFETASAAIAALDRSFRRFGCEGPTSGWMYLDADNQYVGAVLRYDLPDGKAIRPLAKGPDGRWRIGAMPEPRPTQDGLEAVGTSHACCVLGQ